MSDQTIDEARQELDDRALLWHDAKKQWKPIYEDSHPKPVQRQLSIGEFGAEVVATVVVVIASLILAATRTGFQFFLMALATSEHYLRAGIVGENNTANAFALAEMIAAVLCVEGSLFVAGLIKGRKTGSATLSVRQVVVAGAISMICSLGQSFGLVPQLGLSTAFDIIIAVVTGIGSSLIVLFGAEALGAILNNLKVGRTKLATEYQKALDEWNAAFDHNFETEGKRRLFRPRRAQPQPAAVEEHVSETHSFPTGKTDAIRQWLIANSMDPVEVGPDGRISYKDLSALVGIPDNEVRPLVDRLEKRGDRWR